jgi:tRNA(Arg) A34 adenosine deaminase TadA
MNNTQQRHLERAIAIAKTSSQRQRHGCIIAHGPRVLSLGINVFRCTTTITEDPHTNASFHAEIMALRALRTEVKHEKLSLFSARVRKDGTSAMAKPCLRCSAVLAYEGIYQIYWTT